MSVISCGCETWFLTLKRRT